MPTHPTARLVAGATVLFAAAVAAAQTYTVTDLGVLPGSTGAAAFGINDRGWVVGTSGAGFLWKPQTGMQPLPALPGATTAVGRRINLDGVVAGKSDSSFWPKAVRWTGPAAPDLL